MSNNCGPSDRLTGGSMKAFDGLPKAIRQALANADHNWSGQQIARVRRAKRFQDKVGTVAQTVATIREQDIAKHRKDAEAGLVCGGQR
jgi:Family of unknown function (DUF6525)